MLRVGDDHLSHPKRQFTERKQLTRQYHSYGPAKSLVRKKHEGRIEGVYERSAIPLVVDIEDYTLCGGEISMSKLVLGK